MHHPSEPHASQLQKLLPAPVTPSAVSDPLFAQVMAWQFPPLVERLIDKEGLAPEVAANLVDDTKRFLYLLATQSGGASRISPPEVIDTGWHAFLLFSSPYAQFCEEFFGHFLHHRPFTRAERTQMVEAGEARLTVQRTIDRAAELFGTLSANWYAIGHDRGSGELLHGCSDCAGSTNCGGNDPPCC